MRLVNYSAKRDANESEIVAALKAVGASVQRLSSPGVPDLLVGFRGINVLLEIKTQAGRLTKTEKEWHGQWGGQVSVVRSVQDALALLESLMGEDTPGAAFAARTEKEANNEL